MSLDVLAFFTCLFNVYGLLFFMSSAERITDVLKQMNTKAKVYSVLAIVVIAELVVRARVYLIWFLILEYVIFLIKYREKGRECLKPALRGIVLLMAVILSELVIIYFYYYREIENLKHTGKINLEIQIACYFAMAMIEYILIVLREAVKMKSGYKRALMIILTIKAVGDVAWLYISIGTEIFKNRPVEITLLLILEIALDYFAYCIMVLKLAERMVQEKRADIHVNAYEYYLNMEEEHRRIRKMYHEMKNQLMIMEEQNKNRELTSPYGEIMQKKLDELNKFYHTGRSSLDMLLFDGKVKAEKRGIEYEAVVSEGCLSFMEEEDINIIFGNAIINAIEACEKIKDGPKKIKIKAGKNLDDTLVYIKNTVSSDRKKGSLSTNKKNRKMHGIGLTSIQECVEKYNGYVSIMEEENTFQLAILFGKGE